ncbi:deoxyribonuclease V [Acanthopleuribacter pedis]|uniref:Endonuclease V n=1 Tax=Acanthopleuribacter pedis TaxID=442870 RepID=A0A8J7U363_9BACT|nr:deoxyribonuclease V [Acanthopleuribacter pedis]MBO1320058.1 deoxyribonuclease V [Acanthopleuribacter pedis]
MDIRATHRWDLDETEAARLQSDLAAQIECADRFGAVERIAGIDLGYEDADRITRAAVVVLKFPELTLLDYKVVRKPTTFPYVPGYLSFREVPAAIDALNALSVDPQMLFCDGNGTIHPRRFGFACHLGLLADLPCIGVAKNRFIGSHEPLPETQGAWQPIIDHGETIGAVVRSRAGVKPIYVSTGHRVSLESAIRLTLQCCRGFRQPDTTRWSHRVASGPPLESDNLGIGSTLL